LYRRDRLNYLKQSFHQSQQQKFHLGVKLVRGAYMEIERERAEEEGYPSPIQIDKASTDADFNAAITFALNTIIQFPFV
jgi:proline dehydrogenase